MTKFVTCQELEDRLAGVSGGEVDTSGVLSQANQYTDGKFNEAKQYTDNAIAGVSGGEGVDGNALLQQAKDYTDQKVAGIDIPDGADSPLRQDIDANTARIQKAEQKNEEQDTWLNGHDGSLEDHGNRISSLEGKVDEHDEKLSSLQSQHDDLSGWVSTIDEDRLATQNKLNNDVSPKAEKNKEDIADLQGRVGQNEANIANLMETGANAKVYQIERASDIVPGSLVVINVDLSVLERGNSRITRRVPGFGSVVVWEPDNSDIFGRGGSDSTAGSGGTYIPYHTLIGIAKEETKNSGISMSGVGFILS